MAARRQSDLQAALEFLRQAEEALQALAHEEETRTHGAAVLSERERELLACVEEGQTNAQIARALSIAPATVRTHLEHIYRKLDVHSRTAALARARA